jgi:hypothetical protein
VIETNSVSLKLWLHKLLLESKSILEGRLMLHEWKTCEIHTKFLEGRPEWKRLTGRPRRRWEDSIKTHLQKGEYEGASWIHIGQDRKFCE